MGGGSVFQKLRTCRILRAAKNRFGATNEIGVFEMLDTGLAEVENPSQMLLGRPDGAPGTCVMEGMQPVPAEIQALLAPHGLRQRPPLQ